MGHPCYSTEEIARRGREIYKQQLRSQLEPDNIGKFLVIDIETGEYEMDADGELELRSPNGQTEVVDAVIDTGYNGYLAVTPI